MDGDIAPRYYTVGWHHIILALYFIALSISLLIFTLGCILRSFVNYIKD